MKTRFTKMLIEANSLHPDHFRSWVFYPGMLFNSPDKWWGDLGRRDFKHEGIDFCFYRNESGHILRLNPNTRLPAMRDGTVKTLFNDYLGRAVVIEHGSETGQAGCSLSVYAHTTPLAHIKPGCLVSEGDIIGTIADTSHSKAKIPPHLHFTLGDSSAKLVYDQFVWNHMRDGRRFVLRNPISVIDWPWELIAHGSKKGVDI